VKTSREKGISHWEQEAEAMQDNYMQGFFILEQLGFDF